MIGAWRANIVRPCRFTASGRFRAVSFDSSGEAGSAQTMIGGEAPVCVRRRSAAIRSP